APVSAAHIDDSQLSSLFSRNPCVDVKHAKFRAKRLRGFPAIADSRSGVPQCPRMPNSVLVPHRPEIPRASPPKTHPIPQTTEQADNKNPKRISERVLASEFKSGKSTGPQSLPKLLLFLRLSPPQATCASDRVHFDRVRA